MIDYTISEMAMLPSRGLVYEEAINPEVQLKSMTTKHEMARLSVTDTSQKAMADIIDDCIVGNLGISSYDLCLGDYQYLLYKLRAATYGSDYHLTAGCPICGSKNEVVINIDELPLKELTDEEEARELISKYAIITLPVSQNEVTLQLQTPRMLDKITKKAREYNKRTQGVGGDATILFTVMSYVDKIDGETPNPIKFEEWVKSLPMADTNFIMAYGDKLNSLIGVDTTFETTCGTCRREFQLPFQITSSFFRPHIELR